MKYYKTFLIESTLDSQVKLNRNRDYLRSIPKFTFELDRDLHPKVRELLEYMKLRVIIQDVKDLEFGSYFGEEIYEAYMKLLKVLSLIHNDVYSMSNHHQGNQKYNR